jgi:hypothetical protein
MTVTYVPIDGEEVSGAWIGLLRDLRNVDGIRFNVNEGHRTFARQRELIAQKGPWSPSNPTGAAAATDNAPHIWTGRADHAIDFENVAGVITAARKRGVTLRQTVLPYEPWHVVPDLGELRAYNARRARVIRALRRRLKGLRASVSKLARRIKGRTG